MKKFIRLPDVESVTEFVKVTETNDCIVSVSKDGCSFHVDGRSIVGMMVFVGDEIIVDADNCSDEMLELLDKYEIAEKTSA